MNPFDVATAFSLPNEGLTETLLTAVSVPYKLGIFQAALDFHKDTLCKEHRQLWLFLKMALEEKNANDFFVCWHPYISLINRSFVEKDECKIVDTFSRAAAYLSYNGINPQGWHGTLDDRFAIILGSKLLDEVKSIASDNNGELRFGSKQHSSEDVSLETYQCGRSCILTSVDVSTGRSMKILPSGVFQPISGDDFSLAAPSISSDDRNDMVETVRLIGDVDVKYSNWVAYAVRFIVGFPRDKENSFSGSYSDLSGVVKASFLSSPEKMCEVLIHEASHQYYHIACGLSDVDDGSDQTEYYSPPVGGNRPLSRILVAYHAFANITLFYRDCSSRTDALGSFARKNLPRYEEYTRQLAEPLTQSQSLTHVGKLIFQPLNERILA